MRLVIVSRRLVNAVLSTLPVVILMFAVAFSTSRRLRFDPNAGVDRCSVGTSQNIGTVSAALLDEAFWASGYLANVDHGWPKTGVLVFIL